MLDMSWRPCFNGIAIRCVGLYAKAGRGSMKFKVYVETSVISYLAARPSRDVIIAGRQAVTREWWEHYRSRFELLSSVVVEDEAGRGDPAQCARRLELLASKIPRVAVSLEAAEIAARLIEEGGVPASCEEDALHIAIAATQGAIIW